MSKYASFENYLGDKYYNQIFDAIKGYVYRNRGRGLGLYSHTVLDPSYIKLDDIHVNSVSFHSEGGSAITFNAKVQADIILKGMGKRDYDADMVSSWFIVSFSAVLCDGLSMVTITGTSEYSDEKFDRTTALSKFLVPYLYSEDIESEAERFLKTYCPKVLKTPMPIPIDELIENMCLDIYSAPLPDNIFGMMYFNEATVDVYNDEFEVESQEVLPGTILINPEVYFMRNIGSRNNTIVHECVHWDRHGKFFELQKLLNSDVKALKCNVTEEKGKKSSGIEGAYQWMEWQANALTPRILMPKEMTILKLREIIREVALETPDAPDSDIMEKAIIRLADFFQVSKYAAKLRAVELGFTTALGVLNYVDGAYLPSFSFNAESINKDETYIIDLKNAAYEAYISPEASSVFKQGAYVYVQYMFCLDDPKYYFVGDDGAMHLTDYARQHVDECCLKFKNTFAKSETSGDGFYTECALCKNINAQEGRCEANIVVDQYSSLTVEQGNKLKDEAHIAAYCAKALNEIPRTFTGSLNYHIDNYADDNVDKGKLTEMELGLRTNYSDRQIRAFRKDEGLRKDITATCALCIGLHLYPDLSEDLVDKSHYSWGYTEEEYMFKTMLRYHYPESLNVINDMLRAVGYRTWGGKSTGE